MLIFLGKRKRTKIENEAGPPSSAPEVIIIDDDDDDNNNNNNNNDNNDNDNNNNNNNNNNNDSDDATPFLASFVNTLVSSGKYILSFLSLNILIF